MTFDLSQIASLISSIGFPIVMCLILVYFQMTSTKELTEAINKLELAITELIAKEDD